MIVYDGPDGLNEKEKYARDVMVDIFNPALKTMFAQANIEEFTRYGFNSCIQTGIFAGFVLKNALLTDYEVCAYKGQFIDVIDGKFTDYMHCFNTASKDGKTILIDLSRTEKPLMFHEIKVFNYPKDGKYSQMTLLSKEQISIDDHIAMDGGEFYTSLPPTDVIAVLTIRMAQLMSMSAEEREKFKMDAYKQYTHLLDI